MEQVLSEIEESTAVQEDLARSLYRKSHNRYEPSEQITRDYKRPFDKSQRFGKPRKSHESRAKRIFTWINCEPVTLVNRSQADFIERTRASVGRNVRDLGTSRFCADVHGKKTVRDEFDASDILRGSNLNEEILLWRRYLRDLNHFRRTLKKRIPEVPFRNIVDDLSYLDKECVGVLPEDKVFAIIREYRIYPNKEFLTPLLDTLQLRKDENVNYRELLNLLNWRCNMPVLPKMQQASFASSDYVTTYGDSIESLSTFDNTKIRAAGLPSVKSERPSIMLIRTDICSNKNIEDQIFIHCSISPETFTRHGLTHTNIFMARNKEEIWSVFKDVGFQFSKNSFDALWQKALLKDRTGGVCIETFRQLLAASGFVEKEETCE